MTVALCILFLLMFDFITSASSQTCMANGMMNDECVVQEFQRVYKDFMSIATDEESVGSDIAELGQDIEDIGDMYQPLLDCHEKHPFPFNNCYRNVDVQSKKDEKGMSKEEFEDFKCSMLVALMECLEVKTTIYCGLREASLMMEIMGMFKPIFEAECNKTGIVTSHMIQFSF